MALKGDLGWRLNGAKMFVPYADVADFIVVAAKRDSDIRLFVVDAKSPGVAIHSLKNLDLTRRVSRVELKNASAKRLHGGGSALFARLIDVAAVALAADSLGGTERALEMAVDYSKVREQFGKPIGSFQAVKHMLADALVDVEGMRSTVYYAAWCAAADDPERALAASMAKAWCSDASARVMGTGLQVHGGIGFTWEHDMHLYVKRAQLDQVSYGDAPFHRDRIANILRTRLESGQALS
jgi:alkylation response protein AidB-like acyl-CoA dehydrogenase